MTILFSFCILPETVANPQELIISSEDYGHKMKAGWIGQMVGVEWGMPTEFVCRGEILPSSKVPRFKPTRINKAFFNDDLYVELTYVRTLNEHGLDVSSRQAGLDFAGTYYRLWHANNIARYNLRRGKAPPDSGHPRFNIHADDIDFQIEADFTGLISPGMPNSVIRLGNTFGCLTNYGDGIYGGQFVGGMYAAAFFETDIQKIIQAGLECIPPLSQYRECIKDVLGWYRQNPRNWQKTWQQINEKYHLNPNYRRFSCERLPKSGRNIDAKINGAYVVLSLLYGAGDPEKTIRIAIRCGQDSDCNPSNAAGILFTSIGCEALPAKLKHPPNPKTKFLGSPYDFPTLLKVCEKLCRQNVIRAGGRIETTQNGTVLLHIPVKKPEPGPLKQSWIPDPPQESRYSEKELAQIFAEYR